MDIGKSLQFIFEDERWVTKFLIAVVMSFFTFLIVPAWILIGYSVELARNVISGEERPLPEWHDWGAYLKDGFFIMVAVFVYTLPFILIICCATVATGAFGSLSELSEEAVGAGIIATWGLTMCLTMIFIVALFFITPAIYVQYLREGNLGACFQISIVIGIVRDNIGDIVVILAVTFGLSLALGLVGVIPILGWVILFVASPYITLVSGHLYGQLGAKLDGPSKEEKFAT